MPPLDARQRHGLGDRRVLDAARAPSPERVDREAARGRQSGRTQEIQRLIARSLRAVCDLVALGENQITVDCDVLQADGGTRTASICGAYVALHDAFTRLRQARVLAAHPLGDEVAAVSVGIIDAVPMLDLPYAEDSRAEVDMNVVMTGCGRFVEVQGTAERMAFSRGELDELLALAEGGIAQLVEAQRAGPRRAAALADGERGPPASSSSSPRPTPTRRPRSEAILGGRGHRRRCPAPPSCREVDETGATLVENARLKAVALVAARPGGPRSPTTPGSRSTRWVAPRASTRPATPGSTPPTPTTWPSCWPRSTASADGRERRARFVAVAVRRRSRTAPRSWREGAVDGRHRAGRPGDGRLRLRPGLRARRGRRPDLRRDGARREARVQPPGPGLPGAGRPAAAGCA